MTMSNDKVAAIKTQWEAEVAAYLATIHPSGRPLFHIGGQTFREWAGDQGYALPEPDFANDPRLGRRLAQYLRYREHALGRFAPEARAKIEPGFMTFDRWLHDLETSIRYFGDEDIDCMFAPGEPDAKI